VFTKTILSKLNQGRKARSQRVMKKFLSGLLLFASGAVFLQGKPYFEKTSFPKKKSGTTDSTKIYTIYFTIDDGPLEGAPYIDSVFKEEQVPADLFLVGTHVNGGAIFLKYLKMLRNNKWFELDNHSYTHADEKYDYYYAHPRMVLKDMRNNNDSIHFSNKICRMPARNMWRINNLKFNDGFSGDKTADLLKRKKFRVMGWDLEWESDSLSHPVQSPDSLFKQLELAFKNNDSFVPGNVVLLCHDWMFTTPAFKKELQQFIELVKNAGNIRFEWLSNYPGNKKKDNT
jgi:peptidoglycan/xylan/chitin deacetylase (PgdA/CDA1 family)